MAKWYEGGIITIIVGDRYEGEWKTCLKHGNGTDLFHNGDSFTGEYKYGMDWKCISFSR